jgi:hypothetical protein
MPNARHRHEADEVEWTRADAWLLSAVRLSGSPENPASLFDVVAACDAAHHLIPSLIDFEHAMSLLIGAGLVEVDDRGIAVTSAGRKIVADAGRAALDSRGGRGRSANEVRVDELLALLSQVPADPVSWRLDPRSYEAACLEYRHTVWSEFRRPGRPR